MEDNFGIKELYDVSLRCTFPMEINGRKYEENESIIKFDHIQIATLTERKVRNYASGGIGNTRLVDWEDTQEVDFILSEGIVSKTGLAILSNSLLQKNNNTTIIIPYSESLESDSDGVITTLNKVNNNNTLFIYNAQTGEKITPVEVNDNKIKIEESYLLVIVDYTFNYEQNSSSYFIGKRLLNGYLKLDGKFRLRDDEDGYTKTGIIEIPRVKLMSDLSMRLGRDVSPYVYRFNLIGLPVGDKKEKYVCKINILEKEIPVPEE